MLNVTQIPAARIALTDPIDGTITTQWFRFFVNMYTLQGDGTGIVPVINGGTGQSSYTDGQLLIGDSTGNTLVKNTLTAGSNIAITNGPGTIQLDVTLPANIVNTFSAGSTGFTPSAVTSGNVTLTGNLLSTRIDYTAPFTSAVVRTGNAKWSDTVSVKDFGAVGNGSTDDTTAIRAAIATGRAVYFPAGNYLITDSLTLSTTGQIMVGDTKEQSYLTINSSFNMSRSGVIIFTAGTPGLELRDLGMKFVQPDTNNRASLTSYPVAIYAQNVAGFVIQNMKIVNATNGIDMRGNCGNSYVELLQMSAYETGIWIDGSLDTVRINKYHFWNFDMTGNQASIFYTHPTRGFSVGRVDGLFIQQYLNISNLGLAMYQGSSGPPWVYITDSGFDTWNGIDQAAGSLQVVNSYITNAESGGYYGYQVGAGNQFAEFTNVEFFAGPNNGRPMCSIACPDTSVTFTSCYFNNYINAGPIIYVTGTRAFFSMSNCTFNFGSANGLCVWSEGAQQERVHLVNNYINTQANTAYSGPMFQFQPGCRVYMTGNRCNDKGANAATFISNNADDYSWISGNISPGWSNFFAGGSTGYYANNLT